MADIKNIGVLGLGIMGSGIAQSAAMAGYEVIGLDVGEAAFDKARATMTTSLEKMHAKGKINDDPRTVLGRVRFTADAGDMAGVDFVVESVLEDVEVKGRVLEAVDAACGPETIIASNTSQFSITMLASFTKRADRFIGMHWFNPAVIMKLIEVVRGLETSQETLETTLEVCARLGKETVVCQKDTTGFITTRLLSLWGAEAARILEEGVATAEDIDKACRLGFGHPMGPLETSDFSGLDTSLKVRQNLFNVYGERYRPTATMVNLVRAGRLGRKSGRGFYDYGKGGK